MRLFLAVPATSLQGEIRLRWGEVNMGPGFRAVIWEGLHLTLAFIGEVEDAHLPSVTEAAGRASTGAAPFTVRFDRAGGLGAGRTSRIFALQGTSFEYDRLARRARATLAPFGEVAREKRPPVCHLTLGRARDPQPVETVPVSPPVTLDVREIHLMRSQLLPGGAVYQNLHSFALGNIPRGI